MSGKSRFLVLLFLLIGSPVFAQTPITKPTVVLLSWDGLRFDFPDRGTFPGLLRMEQAGVRAGRLIPVFPSNTFPTHVSLATGTFPDRHGIVDNHFYDRREARWYHKSSEADWIKAEPLWIAAERQGVLTATYFWVGSESGYSPGSVKPSARSADISWLTEPISTSR